MLKIIQYIYKIWLYLKGHFEAGICNINIKKTICLLHTSKLAD